MGNLEFCDISTDFSHIVTGNENLGLLRSIGGAKKMLMLFENEVKVFKFSADGTMLAVGFSNGRFNVSNFGIIFKRRVFLSVDELWHII